MHGIPSPDRYHTDNTAQDAIPEIENSLSANDTLSSLDKHTEVSPRMMKDSIIREEFYPVHDTIIPLHDSIMSADYGIVDPDSAILYTDDSLAILFSDSARVLLPRANGGYTAIKDATAFKPNPKTAYLIAAVFPGFGQAYNRQYWKLPIVYGGLVGFIYAITWNNKMYQDYRTAYFDIRTDYNKYIDPDNTEWKDPGKWQTTWQDFIPGNAEGYLTNTNFHTRLQKGRDFYRRYRDLSIILSVAFYFICIADAYVDAQMFDFDVSPDLSFRVAPEFYPSTLANSRSFGLNISMTF